MNPNGLTDEQVKQGYSTLPGNFDPVTGQLKSTITSASLAPQPNVDLSQSFQPQPDLVTPTLAGAANNQNTFQNDYQKYLDLQNQNQDNSLAKMIAGISSDIEGLQGRGAAQQQAEDKLGINQFNQTLAGLSSQRGSKLAELNQSIAQQRAEQAQLEAGAGAKGLTTAMLGGQQAALAKVREAENQTRAAEIGLLDAQILGGQGQLKAAQDAANRAVDLMFQDREATVNTKLKQIELYTPLFNASEKKKADALTFALNKENDRIEAEKANLKQIQGLGIKLAEFGVDNATIQKVVSSKDFNSALLAAGSKLADPRMKLELEKLRLDNALTQQRIATEEKQRSLLGGLTKAEQKAEAEALKNAQGSIPVLQNKVLLMDAIMGSKALDSVVGTTIFSRGAGTAGGAFGRFAAGAGAGAGVGAAAGAPFAGVGAIPGAIVGGLAGGITAASQGAKDTFTGERQNLIASVEQLVSKEFLDSLIATKARGGTFGALTKPEQDALTQSATKIGTWRMREGGKDDGQIIGYNASEKDFKKEINLMKELTAKALQASGGDLYSNDETALLDEVFSGTFDPASLYNQ